MSEIKGWEDRQADGYATAPESKYMQAEIDDLRAALADRDAKLAALEPKENIPGLAADESAFIRWAKKEKYDTSCHPMFFVMLDAKTYAARMGWKAAKDHYAAAGAAPEPTKTVDRARSRFCGCIGRGPDAPYPGMIEAFESHYGQNFTDKDWRNETGIWAAAWGYATRQAGAAPVPEGWRSAVAMAYGHLWHVNNEPMAPTPLRSEESASYAARKLLRDLLTTEERGEAINSVRAMLSSAPKDAP